MIGNFDKYYYNPAYPLEFTVKHKFREIFSDEVIPDEKAAKAFFDMNLPLEELEKADKKPRRKNKRH